MKAVTQNQAMTLSFPIALYARKALKIAGYGALAVGAFYFFGTIGMLIYIGKTSPEVQQAIAEIEPGFLQTLISIIL